MRNNLIRNPLNTMTKALSETNILITRHAESLFNHEMNKVKSNTTYIELEKAKKEIKFNSPLVDCKLTEKGIDQCIKAGKELSDIKIKFLFVSPLKRSLLTGINILSEIIKNNNYYRSNQSCIIVHPLIYERIEDSCDIVGNIHENINEYKSINNIVINWDYCHKVEHLPIFQLKYCDMRVENKKVIRDENYYYNREVEHFEKHSRYNSFDINFTNIIDEMNKLDDYKSAIESNIMTMNRLMEFRKDLEYYLQLLKEDEKILIVGHSELFRHLLAEKVYEDMEPEGKSVIGNCETKGIKFN